jgi:hypothetical protein
MKNKSFIFLFLMVFYLYNTFSSISFADEIVFLDGKSIAADSVWQENETVYYQKFGATISVPGSKVKEIVRQEIIVNYNNEKKSDDSKDSKSRDVCTAGILFSKHKKTVALQEKIKNLQNEIITHNANIKAMMKEVETLGTKEKENWNKPGSGQFRARIQTLQNKIISEIAKRNRVQEELRGQQRRFENWEKTFAKNINK